MLMVGWSATTGCSRRAYRLRADRESDFLIKQKSTDPRWALCDLNVYQDPRSRYFDPNNPDRPPKPSDDPTSAKIMQCLYGKHGMRKWLRDGVSSDVVNPMWLSMMPNYTRILPDGTIVFDIPTANLLGRIHSRDYQRSLEEVYLSSLDVAFERFRFSVQYFGGNDTRFFTNGNEPTAILSRFRQGPPRDSVSLVDSSNVFGFSRRFAAGGQLVASIANSVVWQFSGEDTNFTTSVINWSLVQPLLRGGGRIVVLETLTRAERNLLANLRAMAQFRQDFHRTILLGGDTTIEPARIGGFSGGAGLSGFTGTGAGGFGGVGAGQNFGGVGNGGSGVGSSGAGGQAGFAGGGEGILDGYYGLVQRLQTIRNTEASLSSQELTLGLLEANFAAGLIDIVQVDEFRQNIQTERANLLRANTQFRDTLEAYLVSNINLPPTLKVELDDSLIRQFQLIDPTITATQNIATALIAEIGNLPETSTMELERPISERLIDLANQCQQAVDEVQAEINLLEQQKQTRLAEMDSDDRRDDFTQALATATTNISVLEDRLRDAKDRADRLRRDLAASDAKSASADLVELATDLSSSVQEIGLVQATVRVQRVTIEPVDLPYAEAIEIARANRLDWMNQRSVLVDQWRLVAFNANRLLANLDISVVGDLGTLGDSASRFRGPTDNVDVRVSFDAPLNRKAERNLYREALIEYQRAKRRYVSFVDRVALSLRVRLRQIERLSQNLEIQRQALAIAIRRVDKTLEDLNQPFPPAKPGEAPAQLGPTLAQNLLRALSDLRNTQDNFMSVWLNYEAARINLAFQLGILDVGPDGIINITPLKQARANTTPIETLDEKDIPVEAYLRQLDNVMAHGGDAEKAIQHHPDDQLVKQVETTTGEVITPADVDQSTLANQSVQEKPLVEEPDQPRLETWRERMARVMKLSGKEVPVSISKLDFPRTVREFKALKDQGLSDEAISEKTGWDEAAIKALAEVLETSQRPVVQNIPLQPPTNSPPSENVTLAGHQESVQSPPTKTERTSWEQVETLPEPASVPAPGPDLPVPDEKSPSS
jgi:hypothetical protein